MDHVASGVCFQLYPLARKRQTRTLICYHEGSTRKQTVFKGDLEAAKKECKTLARSVTSGEAAIHLTPLDNRVWLSAKETAAKLGRPADAIVRDYFDAVQILAGSTSVLEAARAWRRQHVKELPAIELGKLIAELKLFLQQKKRDGVTVAGLESILKPLGESFQNVSVGAIITAELERHLASLHLAPRTLNNHRAGIVRLFNYAKGRYLPKDEPTAADTLELISQPERGAIAIYKPWEFKALLGWLVQRSRKAKTPKARNRLEGLLRCELLGGFGGVRTIERCRMEATAIKAQAISATYPHGYVEVKKGVAKRHRTAKRRLIPIQANFAKWIVAFPFPEGPISPYRHPSSLARAATREIHALNKERARAGLPLISRPENGERHSYASYRLPVLKSAGALAIEMNNSEEEIEDNYFELAPPEDVEGWWLIEPPANIIQLDFANLGEPAKAQSNHKS
jgi:hypothetical protein